MRATVIDKTPAWTCFAAKYNMLVGIEAPRRATTRYTLIFTILKEGGLPLINERINKRNPPIKHCQKVIPNGMPPAFTEILANENVRPHMHPRKINKNHGNNLENNDFITLSRQK